MGAAARRHHPQKLRPNSGIGIGAVAAILLCAHSGQTEISIRSGLLEQDSDVGLTNDNRGFDAICIQHLKEALFSYCQLSEPS